MSAQPALKIALALPVISARFRSKFLEDGHCLGKRLSRLGQVIQSQSALAEIRERPPQVEFRSGATRPRDRFRRDWEGVGGFALSEIDTADVVERDYVVNPCLCLPVILHRLVISALLRKNVAD